MKLRALASNLHTSHLFRGQNVLVATLPSLDLLPLIWRSELGAIRKILFLGRRYRKMLIVKAKLLAGKMVLTQGAWVLLESCRA